MRSLIAAVALIAATPALSDITCNNVLLPPPGYDQPVRRLPTVMRIDGTADVPSYCSPKRRCYQIIHKNPDAIAALGRLLNLGSGGNVLSYTANWTRNRQLIGGRVVMPDIPSDSSCYRRLMTHELAHVRGWPASHCMRRPILDGKHHDC